MAGIACVLGMHLRLPGHGDEGASLEIFQYDELEDGLEPKVNRPGFAHIAFAAGKVMTARDAVLAAGTGELGKVVSPRVAGVERNDFSYLKDLRRTSSRCRA